MVDTWEGVLGRLEADVAALESELGDIPNLGDPATLGGRPAPWALPTGLGPLPDHLADRARALGVAQERTALRLVGIRATAARHLAALRAVPTAPEHSPIYLDVKG